MPLLPEALLQILACPACKGDIVERGPMIACKSCGIRFPVNDGLPLMLLSVAIGPDVELNSLYEDPSFAENTEKAGKVLLFCEEHWDEIIRCLAKQPNDLYSLDPRKFEELIAELLCRDGLRVQLTPATRDGGRDILAFLDTSIGSHLHLVECKRFAPHRPITVELVRNLYGVVEAERATSGLLVTTSHFTRDALSFRQIVRHRLTLRDCEDLKEWLRR